jgi:coenzyme F420-0:L-glutamate ligase/coenzyme F420-1:gamma-L-glutamate ligase
MRLEITGLAGLGEVRPGDDLAALIRDAAARERQTIDGSVVLAVAQKVVSKAEGAVVDLRTIEPSALARSWAAEWGKDARLIELILAQSRRIVKMDRGVLVTETRLGFVCANAGVDQSNTAGDEFATVLPEDPDASARRLREALGCGAAIVTDTFGRPWREGLVDVALGVAGLEPLEDYRGSADRGGRPVDAQTGWRAGGPDSRLGLAGSRRLGAGAAKVARAGSVPVSTTNHWRDGSVRMSAQQDKEYGLICLPLNL